MRENTHGKDRLARILLFLLGLLAGLGFCVGAVTSISSLQMKKLGFVPLTPVMKAAGFEKGDSRGDIFSYLSTDPEIELRLSEDYHTLTKNGYRYDARGRFSSSLRTLYVEETFLEDVLGLQIERASFGRIKASPVFADLEEWGWEGIPFMAHAGGGVLRRDASGKWENLTYTNTLEALQSGYGKGFRVFEIDLNLTSDGYLVAAHNWKNQYGGVKSLADFMEGGIWDGLTPMTLEDVMEQMQVNRDMILVLDLKSYQWTEKEIVEHYQTIHDAAILHGGWSTLNRIVPQIYQRSEYDLIKTVYDWKSVIYTLYRDKKIPEEDVLDFVADKDDLAIVTMPKSRVNAEFSAALHAAGKKTCVYTINDLDHLSEWLNQGIDWYVTDTMSPAGWNKMYTD